jgi:O-antigen/teichoic acid export membrane protein
VLNLVFIGTFKKIPSHWVALADQVLVSGANFVIGVILARALGVHVFGIFVIATTFLYYANTFQSALVISPMMTALPNELDLSKRHDLLSGFLGYAFVMCVLSILGVAFISHILGKLFSTIQIGENTLPLLFAIAGFQIQDWLRRALHALSNSGMALLLDLLAYGGHFVGLTIFYFVGKLSPANALISMSVFFLSSALLILVLTKIKPSYTQTVSVITQYWRGSRDFFMAWQFQWAGSQGLMLFGGALLGPQIVGGLRASANLTSLVNVLFQWMENVIPVRAVTHYKNGGKDEMYRFLTRIASIGGVAFGVIVVGMIFFSEQLLVIIYGEEYRPYSLFLILHAIYIWLSHFYKTELFAYRAMQKTLEIAKASFILAAVSIISGVVGLFYLQGKAIVLALILGQSISHLYLIYCRKFL